MLSHERWAQVAGIIGEYLGVIMTSSQAEELVSQKPSLVGEIKEHGVDTQVREDILDVVTQNLIGRDMPLRRDGIDQYKFFRELHDAALEAGYNVSE